MVRRFCFRTRSLIAMLLAFCLVSASMWGYGAEALADALSDEIAVAANGAIGDHSLAGKVCNHGCHAQIHLTGVEPSMLPLSLPDAVEAFSIEGSGNVPTQPRASPFRPPCSPFQA